MGRRRSEPGLFDLAMKADWSFSAGLAVFAAIVSLVVAPMLARSSPLLAAMAPAARACGLVIAVTFGLIAAGKLLMSKRNSSEPPANTASWKRAPVPRHTPAAHTVTDPERRNFVAPQPIDARPVIKPTTWSFELLQSLDWKRFEEVVAAYFREKGFRSETIACGPDGGVDVRLFFRDDPTPAGVVQCKAWSTRQVGVAAVRELLGVMAHENVRRGYFASVGAFSADAIAFAASNPILLITGADLLTAIAKMEPSRAAALLASAVEGEYTTPSCPTCGMKLYRKTFKPGSSAWVCKGYPKCKTKIWSKAS